MSSLAPTLEAFFISRLGRQRQASPHTVAAYRDCVCLFLKYVHQQTGKLPAKLDFEDLDARAVGGFLEHLETVRANTVRTRNARLAALHSFYRYASLRHPEHAELIQRVLAMPTKRFNRVLVPFLTRPETEALLAAPDRSTWIGRRDRALLLLAVQTGLRVSELVRLTCADVQLDHGPHVRCQGKGRKTRSTPLTKQAVFVLRVWMRERRGLPDDPIFPTSRGRILTTDAVEFLIHKHAMTAVRTSPSIATKKVSPHVLRHTCAMRLLEAGVDTSVIALWLGHETLATTQIYLRANLALKERALARTAPMPASPGRYRPADKVLAFLEGL